MNLLTRTFDISKLFKFIVHWKDNVQINEPIGLFQNFSSLQFIFLTIKSNSCKNDFKTFQVYSSQAIQKAMHLLLYNFKTFQVYSSFKILNHFFLTHIYFKTFQVYSSFFLYPNTYTFDFLFQNFSSLQFILILMQVECLVFNFKTFQVYSSFCSCN